MQAQPDLGSYLNDCVNQLDTRMKDFRAKAEANKKKKGSKSDSSKRSAEQVEEHKKIVQRLQKTVLKDPNYESDRVCSYYQDCLL